MRFFNFFVELEEHHFQIILSMIQHSLQKPIGSFQKSTLDFLTLMYQRISFALVLQYYKVPLLFHLLQHNTSILEQAAESFHSIDCLRPSFDALYQQYFVPLHFQRLIQLP